MFCLGSWRACENAERCCEQCFNVFGLVRGQFLETAFRLLQRQLVVVSIGVTANDRIASGRQQSPHAFRSVVIRSAFSASVNHTSPAASRRTVSHFARFPNFAALIGSCEVAAYFSFDRPARVLCTQPAVWPLVCRCVNGSRDRRIGGVRRAWVATC